MRRTAGLLVAMCTLVGLAGVAFAEIQPPVRGFSAPVVRSVTKTGAIENVSAALKRHGKLVDSGRRLTFSYPGASYVKVHFSRLSLRQGDRVIVSNRTGAESYAYTESDLSDGWAMSITGDTAHVRIEHGRYDPLGLRTRLAGLGVRVDQVARGFPDNEVDPAPRVDRGESICRGADEKRHAACYRSTHPVQYQKSKAVARLLINGIELCTAWRVGQNNRMFTNHHCAASNVDVRRTEVWFNFECMACGGGETLPSTKVWGDRLLAINPTLDYALFSVQNFDAIAPFGYLEVDARQPRAGEELYIPQHPRGMPTMIAMDDPGERGGACAVDNPNYFGYDVGTDVSYFCDTEGGSSGSPVLSASTHKVVALHHFGGCPNSGTRMDLIYREVGRLL